ncbi:MAG TPA: helix-turn-helix domain-containing protein [Silvibacterium sp.]|nr:helix-turn-helix domain-containing protein [Silvibacterium sp.]
MSIGIMTAVWTGAMQYEKGELLVLLALADWADDAGRCYPSVARIAEKSRLTERQTYNVLRQLREDGTITLASGGGRGRMTVYRINTQKFAGKKVSSARREKPLNPEIVSVKAQPEAQLGNPEMGDTETLKSATGNPEIFDTPPDPLIGRIVREPSVGTVNKNHSPYPLSRERVDKFSPEVHVDVMSFGRFRLELRRQFDDQPLRHPNFSELVRGESDYDACFRDWWLLQWDRGTTLLTEGENAAMTRRGLEKYRKRIEALMRRHFGAVLEIEVLQQQPPVLRSG